MWQQTIASEISPKKNEPHAIGHLRAIQATGDCAEVIASIGQGRLWQMHAVETEGFFHLISQAIGDNAIMSVTA
jgi:hypothetical protein